MAHEEGHEGDPELDVSGLATALQLALLGDGSVDDTFIGVPSDYVAYRENPLTATHRRDVSEPVQTSTHYVNPRYRPGDNIAIGGLSPQKVQAAQLDLLNAGLIDLDDIGAFGTWGRPEQTAMKNLMTTANGTGYTWEEVASALAEGAEFRTARDAPRGPVRAPFRAQVPNRDEVNRAYRDIRRSQLGGQFIPADDPDFEAEQNAFYETWKTQVVAAQRAAYDGASVVEEPQSLESAALDRIEETEKAGVDANKFRQYAQVLTEALGG